MYNSWQLALKYVRYYLAASSGKGHGLHSPFIFEFVKDVLNDREKYPEYGKVESLRKTLLTDRKKISVDDFGAGSATSRTNIRSVSSIARHAAKSKKFSRLFYRIAKKYRPENMVELGTSLGISSASFALANPAAILHTIEGAASIAEIARANFRQLDLGNIRQYTGRFDDVLPGLLHDLNHVGLAFIDGNHQYEPTMKYFNMLLPEVKNDSILIFDDIHWSGGMEQAWRGIQRNEAVRCTVDLFFIGIVFFREEFREKQHFTIRY